MCNHHCTSRSSLPGMRRTGSRPSHAPVYVRWVQHVQAAGGDRCGFENCGRPPAGSGRYCDGHKDLEDVCGIFRPPGFQATSQPTRSQMTAAYLPEGHHEQGRGRPTVQGDYCTNKVSDGRHVCRSRLCARVHEIFAHRQPTRERRVHDPHRREMRVREQNWQLINHAQRLKRKALVGHFFAVCPCGDSPPPPHKKMPPRGCR